uniref:general stress protein n=1 Tax=Pseudomonas fluorescens TaxID=294 RepID=UPI00130DAA5A|nr:general stress protein [Pseudomonas fluorescens]
MSKKPETGHGFSDNPQKVHDAGGKGGSHQDVKTDRAEKARVGGQHSNGGSDRRGGRS